MMVEFMEKLEELEAWSEGVGLILRQVSASFEQINLIYITF